MQILLCAATGFEIESTLEFIKQKGLEDKIDVLITGVGLVPTAYQITKAVLTKKPQIIIQAGIAGCLDEEIGLGETLIIKNEVIGDAGVEEGGKFKTLFQLNLGDKNSFPWKDGQLPNPNLDQLNITNLEAADAVSVNEISTDKEKIAFYKNEFNAGIESLEGAALHYVGLMENIPFLQLRTVSNFIAERNKTKWIIEEAIANLNTNLQAILFKFATS